MRFRIWSGSARVTGFSPQKEARSRSLQPPPQPPLPTNPPTQHSHTHSARDLEDKRGGRLTRASNALVEQRVGTGSLAQHVLLLECVCGDVAEAEVSHELQRRRPLCRVVIPAALHDASEQEVPSEKKKTLGSALQKKTLVSASFSMGQWSVAHSPSHETHTCSSSRRII